MKKSIFKTVLPLLAVALVGVVFATSCKKDNTKCCGVENPVHELEWMNKMVEDLVPGSYIIYCNYRLKNSNNWNEGFLIGTEVGPGEELTRCSGEIEHFFGGFIWDPSDTNYIIVNQKLVYKKQ